MCRKREKPILWGCCEIPSLRRVKEAKIDWRPKIIIIEVAEEMKRARWHFKKKVAKNGDGGSPCDGRSRILGLAFPTDFPAAFPDQ